MLLGPQILHAATAVTMAAKAKYVSTGLGMNERGEGTEKRTLVN